MHMTDDARTPYSRHNGRGVLRAQVLAMLAAEPPDDRHSDALMGSVLDVSAQAVQQARAAMGIPNRAARKREGWSVAYGLARCPRCIGRTYRVPDGARGVQCPAGHGLIVLSGVVLQQRSGG